MPKRDVRDALSQAIRDMDGQKRSAKAIGNPMVSRAELAGALSGILKLMQAVLDEVDKA